MKLKKYIQASNKLIEMPHNELNLANYIEKFNVGFNDEFSRIPASTNGVIDLMSGGVSGAGLLYLPTAGTSGRRVVVVGKGILFDSGGYSLKKNMNGMHTDMAGAAIASAVGAYFKQNEKANVQAFCPVATNFLHNSKIIVGDRLKIGKKIVEVNNTDAEGRLILAEALSTFHLGKNDIVITVATLTGACGYAVGDKATAIMSPNKKLVSEYMKASNKTKELAWELPLWDYLQKQFDKKVISNISKDKCGTILAGMFLKQFVKYPNNWIHLDVAEIAYNNTTKKGTGEPIKTLVEFIRSIV